MRYAPVPIAQMMSGGEAIIRSMPPGIDENHDQGPVKIRYPREITCI
jgi:hypothetical protein